MCVASSCFRMNTVKVLMTLYCRINMRNNEGDTPMDIARKEGRSKITAELSGLGTNISTFEESFGCDELRHFLFHDKLAFNFDDAKQEKSKWLVDIESNIPASRSSKGSDTKMFSVDSCWQETLEQAQDGVKTKYEVEKSYRNKVDQITQKCFLHEADTRKMHLLKHLDENRSPSAPELAFSLVVHPPSVSRPDSL